MFVRSLALLALTVGLTCGGALRGAEPTKQSLAEVKQTIEAKKGVLIDVREKREWDRGHVEGAILLPLSELQRMTPAQIKARVPSERVLFTHCAVGKRAATAADLLEKQGYDVRCLRPGYKDLLEAGFAPAKD